MVYSPPPLEHIINYTFFVCVHNAGAIQNILEFDDALMHYWVNRKIGSRTENCFHNVDGTSCVCWPKRTANLRRGSARTDSLAARSVYPDGRVLYVVYTFYRLKRTPSVARPRDVISRTVFTISPNPVIRGKWNLNFESFATVVVPRNATAGVETFGTE